MVFGAAARACSRARPSLVFARVSTPALIPWIRGDALVTAPIAWCAGRRHRWKFAPGASGIGRRPAPVLSEGRRGERRFAPCLARTAGTGSPLFGLPLQAARGHTAAKTLRCVFREIRAEPLESARSRRGGGIPSEFLRGALESALGGDVELLEISRRWKFGRGPERAARPAAVLHLHEVMSTGCGGLRGLSFPGCGGRGNQPQRQDGRGHGCGDSALAIGHGSTSITCSFWPFSIGVHGGFFSVAAGCG